MIKLNIVEILSYEDILSSLIEEMHQSNVLSIKITRDTVLLKQEEIIYDSYGINGELYKCAVYQNEKFSNLNKADFINLYENYFRNKEKKIRKIYDEIKVKYTSVCPFCGFGEISAIDHFLPKKVFFQYSVFLKNLLPICHACNNDYKKEEYPKCAEDQIIHPFLDSSKFFEEQWINASYDQDAEVVTYSVNPPSSWNKIDQIRVEKHFNIFGLASRYSTKAASILPGLKRKVSKLKSHDLTLREVEETLCLEIESQSVNHWKKVLYDFVIKDIY